MIERHYRLLREEGTPSVPYEQGRRSLEFTQTTPDMDKTPPAFMEEDQQDKCKIHSLLWSHCKPYTLAIWFTQVTTAIIAIIICHNNLDNYLNLYYPVHSK